MAKKIVCSTENVVSWFLSTRTIRKAKSFRKQNFCRSLWRQIQRNSRQCSETIPDRVFFCHRFSPKQHEFCLGASANTKTYFFFLYSWWIKETKKALLHADNWIYSHCYRERIRVTVPKQVITAFVQRTVRFSLKVIGLQFAEYLHIVGILCLVGDLTVLFLPSVQDQINYYWKINKALLSKKKSVVYSTVWKVFIKHQLS